MIVAIDISPLSTGHSVRGIGFYLLGLKDALLSRFPKETFIFFNTLKELVVVPDVIHFPYFDPFLKSTTSMHGKKIKQIITVHDLTPLVLSDEFPVGVKGKIRWELQKRILQKTNAVIADSQSSKDDIVRYTGIPEEKITVVYLAVGDAFTTVASENKKEATRKKYNLPEKFILYVGDVTPNKNLRRLIEAVRHVKIPLVMVGKALTNSDADISHPWNKDLKYIATTANKFDTIHRLGFIPTEDVVLLYNIAEALIMPSLYEGFGLPVLEAMQCGCPVITTRCGSLPEIAGDAVYYVDPLSVSSIAEGMQKLFSDKKLQRELSEKGIIQATKFSWRKTAEETYSVYEKLYNENN